MVTEEMAARVEHAAAEMGYRPNPFAYSLKTNRSFAVGVLIPDLTNPVFPPIIRGVERTLGDAGYTVILANSDNQGDRELVNLEELKTRQVDGLILATAHREDALIALCRAEEIPFVLVNRRSDEDGVSSVVADDAAGVRAVVSHLATLGHRRIAYIAGPQNLSTGLGRYRGFLDAMRGEGLEPAPDLIAFCDAFTEKEGFRAARDLLAGGGGFSAIVAGNDLLALGCYDALADLGLRCPEDISVTGYNDMPFADKFAPPLTTVRIPLDRMGAAAAKLLLRHMQDAGAGTQSMMLTPELMVRGSTARPSSGG